MFVNVPLALEKIHCPLQKAACDPTLSLSALPAYSHMLKRFLYVGGGRYILRGDRLLSKGMALWDRIGLLFGCLTGSDLALLITCLGVLFSAVCLQCSTASPGHCFCRSLKFPFNWCLNFKLFSLQAGLERFTWIMGTTTSQQVRGKSPSVGSVRKTARN